MGSDGARNRVSATSWPNDENAEARVVAPAEDGGFWSVAISSRVDPANLFAGIEWSTGRECAQTLERAKHLGYNVALADRWDDVDRPEDLRRLMERLKRSGKPDQPLVTAGRACAGTVVKSWTPNALALDEQAVEIANVGPAAPTACANSTFVRIDRRWTSVRR